LWRELGTGRAAEFAALATEVVLVTRGPGHPKAFRGAAPAGHLTVMSSQAWERYSVAWTPYFILVDGRSSTIIAEGAAQSWDGALALVRGEDGSPAREPGAVAQEFPRSWLHPQIEARSGVDSRGLVAREPFRAGEVVIVLAGMHATAAQAEALVARNAAAPRPIMVDDDAYLLQAPDDEAAYASHSCDPSIWFDQGSSLLTRREIGVDEELTIDYATMIGDPRWQLACQCGSACCRGMIGGEDWKRPDVQARYAGHFAPGIARSVLARSVTATD
jgi:uncharacterized protein